MVSVNKVDSVNYGVDSVEYGLCQLLSLSTTVSVNRVDRVDRSKYFLSSIFCRSIFCPVFFVEVLGCLGVRRTTKSSSETWENIHFVHRRDTIDTLKEQHESLKSDFAQLSRCLSWRPGGSSTVIREPPPIGPGVGTPLSLSRWREMRMV